MSEEDTTAPGDESKKGPEDVVGHVKEFAGEAAENVKEFFSGDVAAHAKGLAEDVGGTAKDFGSKLAGLFKRAD